MKGFADYLTEETKEVTFAFGRFNPPTIGHEKLINKVADIANKNNYRIYASHSSDAKKNPLEFKNKVKFMRKMFARHGRNIMADRKPVRTVFDALVNLYNQGFTKVTMVAGSDRVTEFKTLINKYNNVKGRHGFYNFEGGVDVVSAGERDPEAEGATGMSASKMRSAASDGSYDEFAKGLPVSFKDGKQLFNAVRKGMGLKEETDVRRHVEFKPISEEREQYIAGELFSVGDVVAIRENDEVGQVVMLGSNYVLIEMTDGKRVRKWLNAVERLDEATEKKDIKEQRALGKSYMAKQKREAYSSFADFFGRK